jgi:hypothetical protein
MSSYTMKVARPLLLAFVVSSCTASESVAPEAAHTDAVSIGRVVNRGGIEGLRADLAWARSVAGDLENRKRIRIGTANGRDVSIDQLVAGLENQLGLADAGAMVPAPSEGRLGALSPTASPSFDYLSFGDVGGATTIYSSGGPPGFRNITVYAYTTCYRQPSMTIADLKGVININDFATNAPRILDWPYRGDPTPSYTSTSVPMQWSGPALNIRARSTHTCQVGPRGDWPYMNSGAYTIT